LREEAGRSFYLIEDASQALLSDWAAPPQVSRFLFFSPRKFAPVPLGGWCSVRTQVRDPSHEVQAMAWRSLAARLCRGAYLAEPEAPVDQAVESFYLAAFASVDRYLDEHPIDAPIPQVALDLIGAVDWRHAAERRRGNWQQLHDMLGGHIETLNRDLPSNVVPLGYVVRLRDRDEVRARLAGQRIFCPVHWPLPDAVDPQRFPEAAQLSDTTLTLPIDQRYGPDDMARLAEAVKSAL
jgi:hypothetical protein